jgi:hypothetical protein
MHNQQYFPTKFITIQIIYNNQIKQIYEVFYKTK